MKKSIALLLMMTAFAAFCQHNGKITRVIDGDTYVARIKEIEYTCRLENVDTPEKDQFMGLTIKDSVNLLLLNKNCVFEIHGFDKYRRALVNIKLDDQKLDSILITRGWAWFYPAIRSHQYILPLPSLEVNARFSMLGIWKCYFNIPPWIWRQFSKPQKLSFNKCF